MGKTETTRKIGRAWTPGRGGKYCVRLGIRAWCRAELKPRSRGRDDDDMDPEVDELALVTDFVERKVPAQSEEIFGDPPDEKSKFESTEDGRTPVQDEQSDETFHPLFLQDLQPQEPPNSIIFDAFDRPKEINGPRPSQLASGGGRCDHRVALQRIQSYAVQAQSQPKRKNELRTAGGLSRVNDQ
ncbi:hypothetical protein FRC05_008721 [Tulasnella sp. 425]|nr:hypothetical protein FRC05_008721 [Tulasnella sp. 425]